MTKTKTAAPSARGDSGNIEETTVFTPRFGADGVLPVAVTSAATGELLMLALATCYCNDLYREAQRLGIAITGCEVIASARFEAVGLPAGSVTYSARVDSSASEEEIEFLLSETDRLAEIHNTLRSGCRVQRVAWHGPAA